MKDVILLIKTLLDAAIQYMKIKNRRMVLDEYERCEDEVEELEKEITRLRNAGQFDRAGLLLKRQARRARLSVGLASTPEGADLHRPS